jgi:hypothetical protein
MSAPFSSIAVAAEWRKTWQLAAFPRSAARTYRLPILVSALTVSLPPVLLTKSASSAPSRTSAGRPSARYSAIQAMARSPMGTTRSLSPFP